jgi:dienelactone hydrolase
MRLSGGFNSWIFTAACLGLIGNSWAETPTVDSLSSGQVGKVYFKSVDRKTTAGQLSNGKFQLTDTVSGDLILPESGNAPFPVMVIAHGSGGVVKRDYVWAEFFKTQGIASFIIDTYQPRGIRDTIADQSQLTYPASTADHLMALKLLATHPKVDPARIGIIGFSRGGVVSVGTAFNTWRKHIANDLKFAVHLPFYGGCAWIAEQWDGSPIHNFIGDSDDYIQPVATCQAQTRFLEKAGITHSLNIFANARHGFDNLEPTKDFYLARAQTFNKCSYIWNIETQVFYTPAQSESAKSTSGLGAEAEKCASHGTTVGPNRKATEEAKTKVAQILSDTLLKR